MRARGNDTVMPGQEALKKKSVAIGWVLIVVGVICLGLTGIVLSAYEFNQSVYNDRSYWGEDTTAVEQAPTAEMVMMVCSVVVALSTLLAGSYLVSTRTSFNRKLDDMMIQKAMQPSAMYQATTGSKSFCSYCGGQILPGAETCPRCGRKLV